MPNKTIYAKNDCLWELVREYSGATGQSTSNIIELALVQYLGEEKLHAKYVEKLTDTLMLTGMSYETSRDKAERILSRV